MESVVNPACAGMIPNDMWQIRRVSRKPRVCGDDPEPLPGKVTL